MRKLIGTAVAVVLSMMLLPGCCSTAHAGMTTVSVSVSSSSGCPGEGYVYEDCDYDVMDWDNVIILNNNLIGFWVMLPSGNWALRCRAMWYNSSTIEWTYGPWWYDYSVTYGCHCHDSYVSYSCPFHGQRFHVYMDRHYHDWHSHYFVYTYNRYQPRVERHIIVNRGRYYRHDEPVIYRHTTIEKMQPGRSVIPQRTTVITRTREISRPVNNDRNSTEHVRQSCPAATERNTTITRTREVRQPVVGNYRNDRTEKVTANQGNSRQTEMTRTRTTTRERSNGNGNSSSRTQSRSTSRTTHRGK